eukprot:6470774-Amphidinium_carterae.1
MPEGPSRVACHTELVHEWKNVITIQTLQDLLPAKAAEWRDEVVRDEVRDGADAMLPWIKKQPRKLRLTQSICYNGFRHQRHGRFLHKGEVDLRIHHWSWQWRGVASRFKKESDPVNGQQIKMRKAEETEITKDDSTSQIGQAEETMLPPARS